MDGLDVLLGLGRTGRHPIDKGAGASRESLAVTLVQPELVVETGVDVARDVGGRWRHPARLHRPRTDLSPTDIPPLAAP